MQTNIKTHSDIDLLSIIDSYHYHIPKESELKNEYTGDPDYDINEFRRQAVKILRNIYDEVDDSGTKAISIYNKNLRRKADIVLCYWYNSKEFKESYNEYYRGVYLYDFKSKQKDKIDYPFAHIRNVQSKGNSTFDGFRRGVRLVKNLKADSEDRINLSSFQLTSIVYSIDNTSLVYTKGLELRIAENISSHLGKLINEPTFRKGILSPNEKEKPLNNDNIVPQLKELKIDLDQLVQDCKSDLRNNYFEKSLNNY